MDLASLIQFITNGTLTEEQAQSAAYALADEGVDAEEKKAFLSTLAQRGEAPSEVAAFARAFRQMARDPGLEEWSPKGIDVCGTGGDHSGSFNISTTVAFILASAGVPVLKHGNRSITSQSGSADLLTALGFPLELELEQLRESVETLNFCFLFAPQFHPAFKSIVPVRKALAAQGQRTIFNLLGPLINPAKPAYQLLGVFDKAWVHPLAEALEGLGLKRGLVVHGALEKGGMDELSCAAHNHIAGCGQLKDARALPRLEELGLKNCSPTALTGGKAEDNVNILNNLLKQEGHAGLLDTVFLNAGAALWVADKANHLSQGVSLARELVLDGTVQAWLNKAQAFYRKLENRK